MSVTSATPSSSVITSTAPTTSSASSTASAVTTSAIDVASIVAQLMTVENQPLTTLKANITQNQTLISDLGVMKSKIATLQSALQTFENPSTYNNPTASSGDSTVVTATATSSAAIGSVAVQVSQLATASAFTVSKNGTTNFSSASDVINIDPVNGFQVQIGGITYNTNGEKTTGTNPPVENAIPKIQTSGAGSTSTAADLISWINGLGANLNANIVQTTSPTNWVIQINGTQTGTANAVSVLQGSGSDALVTQNGPSAQDAIATIGGITVNRPSNSISDVVNGITFNLVGKSSGSSTNITIAAGADNSSAMINTLITAYNNVINQYNTYTANSANSATPGDFANNPTMLSFVNNIKSMFANGATDASSITVKGFASGSDAMSLDKVNGYLQVGASKFQFSSMTQATPSVNDYISWVNSLGAGVSASLVTSGSSVSISISNRTRSGNSAIDLSGINAATQRNTTSLSAMGMDLQLDGTMQFNTVSYQKAVESGLAGKLATGLNMGYASVSNNLETFLTSQIDLASGTLASEISAEKSKVADMQKRQSDLQDHINGIQNNYITQYSALNALLFQLNATSTSLTSALTAITNINAGK